MFTYERSINMAQSNPFQFWLNRFTNEQFDSSISKQIILICKQSLNHFCLFYEFSISARGHRGFDSSARAWYITCPAVTICPDSIKKDVWYWRFEYQNTCTCPRRDNMIGLIQYFNDCNISHVPHDFLSRTGSISKSLYLIQLFWLP